MALVCGNFTIFYRFCINISLGAPSGPGEPLPHLVKSAW
jgi:hypothetical protein